MMNTFEQSSEFLEQLSQIIDILTIIRDNGDVSSPLDRDVALEQIRFAYAALLKAGQSGNAEVERQAREEQLRKEQEERERAAREEQLRKEKEERERAAREEQLRKEQEERERAAREEQLRKEQEERERAAREEQLRKEKEERERAAREEQLRKEQEERERAAREEQLKKTKQENQGSKTSGAPNLFDIFTPISEAGKQQGTTATVASQVSEKQSLNDLLQSRNPEKPTIYSKMHDAKIEDLAKAISLNDKFLFIKELFRNQGEDFSKAITTLNQCANLEEAFEELEKMKKFYFWDSVSPAYLSLCDLVRRRFS